MAAGYGRAVTDLPFVDRPAVEVAAPPAVTWRALADHFGGGGSSGGAIGGLFARAVGVRHRDRGGAFPAPGSTIRGFRVARSEEPRLLLLEGSHRFARYELEFEIEPLAGGTSSLAATTRAAFPGVHGRLYRAAVIDAGTHRVAMRRMLGAIRTRAERA